MIFDNALKRIVTEKSILEAVDEETLYCFYMDIEELSLHKDYPTPYRVDSKPSFGVYKPNSVNYYGCEYMWKDHATREVGDIFGLVKKIYNLNSNRDAVIRIAADFGIRSDYNSESDKGERRTSLRTQLSVSPAKIRVKSTEFTEEGLAFWKKLEVGVELLREYNVTQISHYWSYEGQDYPYVAIDPTFAYRIGEYYQIYSPNAIRRNRFRNDLPLNYFFGYLQLPASGETLIIDKSMKDVIFCRRLGLWAIAPKSETTMIPHNKMLELISRFKNVYIMLDNDEAGRIAMERYVELYPTLKVRLLQQAKDKTDLCLSVGFNESERIIKQLIAA